MLALLVLLVALGTTQRQCYGLCMVDNAVTQDIEDATKNRESFLKKSIASNLIAEAKTLSKEYYAK